MAQGEVFRQNLIEYLQTAFAMENEVFEILQRQIDYLGHRSELHQRLERHLRATDRQRRRMADRLEAYGEAPGMLANATSKLKGNLIGISGLLGTNKTSQLLRDDYVTEHMEIATYTALIAVADAYGDLVTVRDAKLSLKEELAMAEWLFERIRSACYEDLQAQGVIIAEELLSQAKQEPAFRVTLAPPEPQHTKHASHQGKRHKSS
jgi:ferritin-like metal-binding protein YciE